MPAGEAALRFTLARTVDLVAVSSSPRPSGPDALPAHVRLVDLATASEVAELAASTGGPAEQGSPPEPPGDPGGLDGLIARAEARLVETRTGPAARPIPGPP